MKRPIYRYTNDKNAFGTTPLRELTLRGRPVKQNVTPEGENLAVLRITIPEDLVLVHYHGVDTTDDHRTLREVGYQMSVWNKASKRWEARNELKGIPLEDIHKIVKDGTMESLLQADRFMREAYAHRALDYFNIRNAIRPKKRTNGDLNALILRLQNLYRTETPAQYEDNRNIR